MLPQEQSRSVFGVDSIAEVYRSMMDDLGLLLTSSAFGKCSPIGCLSPYSGAQYCSLKACCTAADLVPVSSLQRPSGLQ